jgi:hypothetical protein
MRYSPILTVLLAGVLLHGPDARSQILIDDHFEGDTLSSIWIQTSGDKSNYEVSNSNLKITNTVGGTLDETWRCVTFFAEFNAPTGFYLASSFNFAWDDYKLFEVSLHATMVEPPLVNFRIWDSPSDCIHVWTPSDTLKLYPPPYVPTDVEIKRANDTVRVSRDDTVRYTSLFADSIKYIRLRAAQWTGDGDGFNPVAVDSVYARSYCCLPPTVGDIDQSEVVDITDVQLLVDNQFLSLTPLVCGAEGDIDFSGVVDITDLQILIDNQFLTLTPLPACP